MYLVSSFTSSRYIDDGVMPTGAFGLEAALYTLPNSNFAMWPGSSYFPTGEDSGVRTWQSILKSLYQKNAIALRMTGE